MTWMGGPGLPDRVRIAEGTLESKSVLEQNRFGRFIKEAERSGDDLMRHLGKKMEDKAQRYAPSRTGALRKSIKYYPLNNWREVRVVSDVPYAGIMESGSKPHLIHGVRANFRWKNGTRRFVWNDPKYGPTEDFYGMDDDLGYINWSRAHGATVRHPGTKPHLFFSRAFHETWQEARFIMRRVYT